MILATTDGGASWRLQGPGTANALYDIAPADLSHVWPAGSGGTILVAAAVILRRRSRRAR